MNDLSILRGLAWQYAQAAQSKQNEERRILHRAVNDLKMIRPVVLIAEIPFHELDFDGSLTLQCQDEVFRDAENFFRRKLFQWKYFPADMILTPYFPVGKIVKNSGIGVEVDQKTLAADQNNHIVAHEYHDQIATEEDLAKIHMPVLTYEEAATRARFEKIANAIGDILPVRITGQNSYMSMWDKISSLRGVTPLLIDLAERPEFSHAIIRKFADIEISLSEQMEKLGLYEANPIDIHCTSALNSTLPGESDGSPVKRSQVWGRGMAQIFSSVSKAMHEEFDINYMKEVMEPFGLTYYGCCEPLDRKIDIVEKLPHLRKISITPWADVDVAAEAIGPKYVLANKPNPAAVAVSLEEDALRRDITRTLSACRRNGCSCDIVLKDISSVNYRLDNLVRWERTVMDLVQRY
ncbi:MAG: hypothetical protein ACOX6P_07910 [Candidatus Merdivicinus sp.]